MLRAALKLEELRFEPTVVAALRADGSGEREERRGGVRVVRVGPRSALARRLVRGLRGRLTGGPAAGAPGAAPPPGAASRSAGRSAARGARRVGRMLAAADFNLRAIGQLRRLQPDLVQCNDYNTMWVGLAARALHASAVVYDSHEIWPDRNLRPEARWWLLAWEALFVRVAHRVVMTSPAHAEVLARRYRVAMPTVVRNIPGRNAAPAPSSASPAAVPEGASGPNGPAPVAVYVGGLLRNRGLEQSIRAIARLERLRLRLLGPVEADYRAELESLAGEAGVADRVELAPPVPPTEVVAALRSADVGLALFQPGCLSHRLVLPNKLFEYAHAGLPIVGSDLPMITRFVHEHGVGATVDPEDVDAIAGALSEVLAPARHERLRAAARAAGETLDWQHESELLADVYRDALARADVR